MGTVLVNSLEITHGRGHQLGLLLLLSGGKELLVLAIDLLRNLIGLYLVLLRVVRDLHEVKEAAAVLKRGSMRPLLPCLDHLLPLLILVLLVCSPQPFIEGLFINRSLLNLQLAQLIVSLLFLDGDDAILQVIRLFLLP